MLGYRVISSAIVTLVAFIGGLVVFLVRTALHASLAIEKWLL